MSARKKRTGLPEDVSFPVTPFLDMAFQLLAFFVLTYQPPTQETRLDLYLPSSPIALPRSSNLQGTGLAADDPDLETDLLIRAEANPDGSLSSLKLGDTIVKSAEDLGGRLKKYVALIDNKPVRVRMMAPDSLRYEDAARLIGACVSAGVASVKLSGPAEERP